MNLITGENNKILRQKSKEVTQIDQEVHLLIQEMKKIMIENNGIGLAAIQLGVPQRVIVTYVNDKFRAFINPQIIKFSPETSSLIEGCLSLPGYWGEVERPEKIALRAISEQGKKIKLKAFGLLARVIQHEVDHLNGILFIDKAKEVHKESGKINVL